MIETIKAIVTSLAVIFYVLYHQCLPEQRALMLRIITYRPRTTDEEIRSETALLFALSNKIEQTLSFFINMERYLDSRELFVNDVLTQLAGFIPNSKKSLIASTIDKRWYYEGIHRCHIQGRIDLIDSFIRALSRSFDAQADRSFNATLVFAANVHQQLVSIPSHAREYVLSALYYFCLGQYVELRRGAPETSSFFSFSGATKCSAAKKIQQQERGHLVWLSFREFGATKEGRLSTLVEMFEGYRHQQAEGNMHPSLP